MVAAAGAGGYLVLLLTIRGHEVVVPDLARMTLADAEKEATSHELTIEVVGSRVEPRVPEGRIFEQEPRAGAKTRPQRAVKVYLSLGQGSIEVPYLAGAPLRKAQVTLEQLGLRVGTLAYIPSREQPPDGVLAQSPAGGVRRQKGDAVDLLVSRGAPARVYVMPDLAGLDVDRAGAILKDVGVRIGMTKKSSPGRPSGTILEQRPAGGFPLNEREAVQLVVAE
jgi:serine/threonine-protein kinase